MRPVMLSNSTRITRIFTNEYGFSKIRVHSCHLLIQKLLSSYNMRPLLIVLFFIILCPAISPQEEDAVYIINSFIFNITGFTRPDALIRKGELTTGIEITGFSDLEKYIQEKTQILYNERVLDSVSIDYEIGQEDSDGKLPVDIVINTRDTWNIVAIPRPRYSSNDGFDITLKARDYNFMGTMSPLRLDIGYTYDNERRSSFLFMLDSNIPFNAFGLLWGFKFVNTFIYRAGSEQPFYYRNTTGLYVELPVKATTFTVGLDESFFLNDENADIYKPLYGYYQDGLFITTNPYISWEIPTGFDIGDWGGLVYTTRLAVVFNHELPGWPLDEHRKGTSLTYRHSLGFDRIDWIVNFKRGLDVYVNNSINFNFYDLKNNKNPWTGTLALSGIGHFTITDFFGVSTNLKYRQWFAYEHGYTTAGDSLRGILDKDIYTDFMLSLNLDLPIRVLRFSPSVWLNNQRLRLFNFDLHFSPIIDMALYHDLTNISSNNMETLFCGGFEIIVFPEFFRSLFLRISVGKNLADFNSASEIFIGTEFHY